MILKIYEINQLAFEGKYEVLFANGFFSVDYWKHPQKVSLNIQSVYADKFILDWHKSAGKIRHFYPSNAYRISNKIENLTVNIVIFNVETCNYCKSLSLKKECGCNQKTVEEKNES